MRSMNRNVDIAIGSPGVRGVPGLAVTVTALGYGSGAVLEIARTLLSFLQNARRASAVSQRYPRMLRVSKFAFPAGKTRL
jgi:hypothetical protein